MSAVAIVVILVVGIVLLLVELFVIPGFGVAGALGIFALLAGTAAAWVELGPEAGLAAGAVAAGITGLLFYVVAKTGIGKRFVLKEGLPEAISQPDQTSLLNRQGVAVTPLRPIGRAVFGGEEVDVVTDGDYIEAGERLTVIAVEGVRVVVQSTNEN